MLYTLNKSPLTTHNLSSLLRIASAGAPILLLEDGVYGALAGGATEATLLTALADHPLYALSADLEARGISRVIAGIQVIGFDGFVSLVEQHNVVPWL
jgi:tRNA 2-thiouridine synthesizing protein B